MPGQAQDQRAKGQTTERLALAADFARIPEEICGNGHLKQRHLHATKVTWETLNGQWRVA